MKRETARNEHIRLEEDITPAGFLLAMIISFVAVILLGIGWSWLLFERETLRLGGLEPPTSVRAPRSIVGVNQTLIHVERHGQRLEAEQRRVLLQSGWIDREGGVVRIPIDDAIGIIAEEAKK